MSIRWLFSGLSGVIGLPIVAWLIITFGWRIACVVGGVVMWTIGLPLVFFFVKSHRPEYYGMFPDGATFETDNEEDAIRAGIEYAAETGEVEFSTRQALVTPAFWLLITAQMFHMALYPVMGIHCIPFLTDRGMNPMAAAATMSVYVTASIPARFFGGLIVDRVKTSSIAYLIGGSYFMQSLGVTLFLFNQQSMFILYVFFILYGFGMGASMPLNPVIRARYFGRKSFGTIAGLSRTLMMPVGIAGPIIAGWIYDYTGSYVQAFVIFAITLCLSGLILCVIRPPELPKSLQDAESLSA